MLHTLPAAKMREKWARHRKSLTPGNRNLMPPAILSGRSTRSRKNPQAVSIALPASAWRSLWISREALTGAKKRKQLNTLIVILSRFLELNV
jgi:hypothetical protein